jgi:hypothetical protein
MRTSNNFGLRIPDSKVAREATQLVRDTESELLFHHSTRTYLWGALAASRQGIVFDPELLYVGALFHDMGLTEGFAGSPLRFEVDSANAARNFLRDHGIPEADVHKVWTAIAFHTTPGIPEFLHAEASLLQAGAAMDVAGLSYDQFTDDERAVVVAEYPREDNFKHRLIDAFYEGMKHRPLSTFGTFNEDIIAFKDPTYKGMDMCSLILHSPWAT